MLISNRNLPLDNSVILIGQIIEDYRRSMLDSNDIKAILKEIFDNHKFMRNICVHQMICKLLLYMKKDNDIEDEVILHYLTINLEENKLPLSNSSLIRVIFSVNLQYRIIPMIDLVELVTSIEDCFSRKYLIDIFGILSNYVGNDIVNDCLYYMLYKNVFTDDTDNVPSYMVRNFELCTEAINFHLTNRQGAYFLNILDSQSSNLTTLVNFTNEVMKKANWDAYRKMFEKDREYIEKYIL